MPFMRQLFRAGVKRRIPLTTERRELRCFKSRRIAIDIYWALTHHPNRFIEIQRQWGRVPPPGWDGDAWCAGSPPTLYWQCAWNKSTGQFAIATGAKYLDTRELLLQKIGSGGDGIVQCVPMRVDWPESH